MDRPEFIITFRAVAHHPELSQPDSTVFGYIYWMTRLKNEKCFASNNTLATLTGLSVSAVRNALTRLEKTGFIRRVYSDSNPTEREEIVPLMGFSSILGATAIAGGVPQPEHPPATAEEHTIKKSIKEEQYNISEEENSPRKQKSSLDGFESWWNLYPKRKNKPQASAEWRKLSPEDRFEARKGAERVAKVKVINHTFLPMPGNYLRDRRWEDEETVKSEPKVHKF